MKRSLLFSAVVGIVVVFESCGKPPEVCDPEWLLSRNEAKSQLCSDRDSLGFAQEFNSGTYIGTRPVETLGIRNGGIDDLVISSVSISGDPQFKYSASWDPDPTDATIPGTSVKGKTSVFIQVEFAPTAAKAYSGTITINSNAENAPSKVFQVSGCGVPTDGGTSPCYFARDAGGADAG